MRTAERKNAWPQGLIVVSILIIAVCTLFPFSFSFSNIQSIKEALSSFSYDISTKDIVGNILLFLPLGFGWAAFINSKRKKYRPLISSLCLCSGLTITVECLQLFIPERTSSFTDILLNTCGGLLGTICFQRWGARLIEKAIVSFKQYLSARTLVIAFVLYAFLALSFSAYGLKKMTLANWKPKIPITLGNEQSGDRPWLGSISELWVTDEALRVKETKAILGGQSPSALNSDHLVAFYQLGNEGSRIDQSGNLPDLIWQGDPSASPSELGLFSSPDSWLQTSEPVTRLVRKLKRTNQFSLGIKFQARSLEQVGPARLVSLSKQHEDWNFMLGQDNKSLVFRLHMLFAENGNDVDPQVKFPRVFVDNLPHQIVITYTGELIQIYIDSIRRRRSFELTPIFVMSKLQNLWFSNIDSSSIRLYRYLYYFTFFAPLGMILGLFAVINRMTIQKSLLICIGFVVPPIALQYSVMGNEWQRSNQDNLELSFLMMAMIILAINIYPRLRGWRQVRD